MRSPAVAIGLVALAACARADDPLASRDAAVSADAATGGDSAPPADARTSFDQLVLNEFVFNHAGSDTHEFVEVAGPASTDHSAAAVVVIDGDAVNAGLITFAEPVGSTSAAGYWVSSFFSDTLENGSQTLLLVDGFSGSVGDDLDGDDDGTLDVEPWAQILDAVAIDDGDAGDVVHASPVLAPDHPGGALPVAGASRVPDGADSDQAGDWVRNDFDGSGLACCSGASAETGEAVNTPGAANRVEP